MDRPVNHARWLHRRIDVSSLRPGPCRIPVNVLRLDCCVENREELFNLTEDDVKTIRRVTWVYAKLYPALNVVSLLAGYVVLILSTVWVCRAGGYLRKQCRLRASMKGMLGGALVAGAASLFLFAYSFLFVTADYGESSLVMHKFFYYVTLPGAFLGDIPGIRQTWPLMYASLWGQFLVAGLTVALAHRWLKGRE